MGSPIDFRIPAVVRRNTTANERVTDCDHLVEPNKMSHQNRFLLPQPTSLASNSGSITGGATKGAAQENEFQVDTNFDSYWEEEARNPHRNRIRVGRQYQARLPQILKPGEIDPRILEELETMSFCPRRSAKLSDAELNHYLTIAKSLNIFAKMVQAKSLPGQETAIADLNRILDKEGPSTSNPSDSNASTSSFKEHADSSRISESGEAERQTPAQNPKSSCKIETLSDGQPETGTIDARMSVYNFNDEIKEDSSPGTEVKPLKARPIISPKTSDRSEPSSSNVGSLNFFMDGQLVLKLNARQEKKKCHWVQSGDKLSPTKKKR